jgi:hypothetical protein
LVRRIDAVDDVVPGLRGERLARSNERADERFEIHERVLQ